MSQSDITDYSEENQFKRRRRADWIETPPQGSAKTGRKRHLLIYITAWHKQEALEISLGLRPDRMSQSDITDYSEENQFKRRRRADWIETHPQGSAELIPGNATKPGPKKPKICLLTTFPTTERINEANRKC
jgi:hypothetical protein